MNVFAISIVSTSSGYGLYVCAENESFSITILKLQKPYLEFIVGGEIIKNVSFLRLLLKSRRHLKLI